MKIAIISDIHDNLVNLKKCLDWCTTVGVSKLICCGDVTNQKTLRFLANAFSGQVFLVRGNVDSWNDEIATDYDHLHLLDREGGTIELEGKKIGACHEPHLVDKLISREHPEVIFYGHTHQPWSAFARGSVDKDVFEKTTSADQRSSLKREGKTLLINPGTLGGMFTKATFAIYDPADGSLELKILESLHQTEK